METTVTLENKLASTSNSTSELWTQGTVDSNIPSEPLSHDDGTIWQIVTIVFGALAIIVIMFLIAIFIDCRQQKLVEIQQAEQQKHYVRKRKLRLPKLGRAKPDHERFARKMQTLGHSEPPV